MKFGEFIKLLRLEKEISLREFAKISGIDVAFLSRIERGISPPPQKVELINSIANSLKLNSNQKQELLDLSAAENGDYPSDLKKSLTQLEAIPILLRTINNKKLTDDEIKKLAERINQEY